MKALIVLLATGTVMLAQPTAPTQSAAPKAPVESPLLHPDLLKAKAPDLFRVKFATTKGDIVIEVHRDWAPIGADRFYNLVKNHFFTDASFFRVVKGFMAQFGIPANPKIAAVWESANIKDDPVKQSNKKGMVTFANTGQPNSRGAQMFINLADNSFLDGQLFAPFGTVTEGMAVVESLYNEYGDGPPRGRGPDQGLIQSQGKAYLDKSFPKMDSIKSATILPAEGATPAAPKK
jgi:peptidyl-prolyl cis-trans isomerase A (cyclophilin A)